MPEFVRPPRLHGPIATCGLSTIASAWHEVLSPHCTILLPLLTLRSVWVASGNRLNMVGTISFLLRKS